MPAPKKKALLKKAPLKKAVPSKAPSTMPIRGITYDAVFEERISRLFIFRFLWIFVEAWVLIVWGIWISIIRFLHFWYMLILGQRSRALWQKEMRFFRHVIKWVSYWKYVVNTRPLFIEP